MTCCSELPAVGFAGTLMVFSHVGNHPKLPQTTLFLAVALKYHERDCQVHLAFQPPHFYTVLLLFRDNSGRWTVRTQDFKPL